MYICEKNEQCSLGSCNLNVIWCKLYCILYTNGLCPIYLPIMVDQKLRWVDQRSE